MDQPALPAAQGALPPQTAAEYMNWAEYLSYINPRMRSYDQYLLVDGPDELGFASGFELSNGRKLATFDAFELPLFLPTTTATSQSDKLLVWGAVRPAPYALSATSLTPTAQLQFQPGSHGAFQTLQTISTTNAEGYFTVKQAFPSSGTVRLAWTSPTGTTVDSRSVTIVVN